MTQKTKTAVVLAAGVGQRLDIFETPKPLVRVGGKSLIVRTLSTLKDAGVTKAFILVRKNDTLMRKELVDFPLDITFVEQTKQRSTMLNSLLLMQEYVQGSFFVTMCDMIFEQNPYKKFQKKTGDIRILVSVDAKHNEIAGAEVKISHEKNAITYISSNADYNALEAGVYFFTEKGFQDFVKIAKKRRKATTLTEIFATYNKKQKLEPVLLRGIEWYDVNTPVTLIRAELMLQRLRPPTRQKKLSKKSSSYTPLTVTAALRHREDVTIDVHIQRGIIKGLENYEIIPHEHYFSPHYLIVDKNIDKLYGDPIYKKLRSLGYNISKMCLDPGDQTKSVENYTRLASDIITRGVDKKSIIISVGGGVIKDLAGFLAATLYRGITFMSFPTTVLSQCDAAIALKQGVNGEKGKNLLGSFYAPKAVFVDPEVLRTLDERYVRDGLAECLKLAFSHDKKLYRLFEDYTGKVIDLDFLEQVITRSIALKVESIEEDYHEDNKSLINQYGHEVGHAIEYLSGFKFGHGEAVAIGMRVSAELSHVLGICSKEVVEAHISLLKKYQLPYSVPKEINVSDIARMIRYDKKYHGGESRFVLVNHIGSIWHDKQYYTVLVSEDNLREALSRSYA